MTVDNADLTARKMRTIPNSIMIANCVYAFLIFSANVFWTLSQGSGEPQFLVTAGLLPILQVLLMSFALAQSPQHINAVCKGRDDAQDAAGDV